jgi:uncharacterized protein (TIGR00255 family)
MIRSMTAFGRGENEAEGMLITVEIRTVNHRFRDVSLRLPLQLQAMEAELRSMLNTAVGRGRIDAAVNAVAYGDRPDVRVELNLPLARAYAGLFRQLQEELGADPSFRAETLCQFKDVVALRPVERDLEALKGPVHAAFSAALDAVDRMRINEGMAIDEDFRQRLALIRDRLDEVAARAPLVVEEYRARLRERIAAVSEGMEPDGNRLAQETAYFANRCDITEEIVRTRSHLDRFEEYLGEEGSVGRRLEFLIQEMNREVNTISSKASDSPISRAAVEVKGELEKLREQVQNVE